MTERRPLYYTFGNHMHWVDMQWLWGYGVLPGCVADMLRLCEETGARGCVNFDGIGYEKMAAESPRALADLRRAVERGDVEPVGCSYGQPYGLFHGGESNVRQFTFGARSVLRLLGVRPRTFWEEEFYFFPQLPQILSSCGFTGASLFFQWTWHTPEMPLEAASLVRWEGIDGTGLPALPRNALNVHQWPEDFDGLLEQGLIGELESPAIVQWLELMPSRDWMCRSEVLLPRLRELMGDRRFDVRPRTCERLIAEIAEREPGPPPVRAYTMDDVWHGMTLGKNGDAHPRESRRCEQKIVAGEAISALLGLFGRPYAGWDVYPTWELEEAWRETLSAQHHDNHECEGLCGSIGRESFGRALGLAQEVQDRSLELLADRLDAIEGTPVIFNGAGLPRDLLLTTSLDTRGEIVGDVPAFGYRAMPRATAGAPRAKAYRERGAIVIAQGDLRVEIDTRRGVIRQIFSEHFPRGVLDPERPVAGLSMTLGGVEEAFDEVEVELDEVAGRPTAFIARTFAGAEGGVGLRVSISPILGAVDVEFVSEHVPRPDPGMHTGLRTGVAPRFDVFEIVHDHPSAVSRVRAEGRFRRKYPTGDWMTSPQVFEEIHRPFTALTFVDLVGTDGSGLLCRHDGSQQWFRNDAGVECLLTAYDAWDEARYDGRLHASVAYLPHGPMDDAARVRLAAGGEWLVGMHAGSRGDLPDVFGPFEVVGAPGVFAQAFFRESMRSGEDLPDWAGHRMASESGGACTHPYVVRLVEWAGEASEVTLKLPGEVASAAKTNLMGETGGWAEGEAPPDAPPHLRDTGWIAAEPAEPPLWARGASIRGAAIGWSSVRFGVRPREIVTVMADLVMGRKQYRDLDARREVWATVHRKEPG